MDGGMPEMQEQFPADPMDGGNAGNAGAISGEPHGGPECRKCRSNFRRTAMDGGNARNAGSNFRRTPWMAGMPEMPEQFPAGRANWRPASKWARRTAFLYGNMRRHPNP
jgi:hypothetical protein